MSLKCGLVGLPNVGKSTLFNALTATASAEAANFPFCTIEPNIGKVAIPDDRLQQLAEICSSAKVIPAQLEFVDIAGLVKGASKGEGLGNQFLGHIREVAAIVQVLRCFEDPDITHVAGSVDPLRDLDTINTELILADLEVVERKEASIEKLIRRGDSEAAEIKKLLAKIKPVLEQGTMASTLSYSPEEQRLLKMIGILSSKPQLIVANVLDTDAASGNEHTQVVAEYCKQHQLEMVIISSQIEAEISTLESSAEKAEFLGELGLAETGLAKIARASFVLLGLCTYFTAGPQEARAWIIPSNCLAPKAAGVIHTDFERGFIRAEVTSFADFTACKGESGARDAGKLRIEGKEYAVQDGDVVHFRFNV